MACFAAVIEAAIGFGIGGIVEELLGLFVQICMNILQKKWCWCCMDPGKEGEKRWCSDAVGSEPLNEVEVHRDCETFG